MELIKEYWERLWQNFTRIVLTGIMFAAIGWGAPKLYFRHFDRTNYYEIELIKPLDNPAKMCEDMNMLFVRNVPITVTAKSYVELSLVRIDGADEVSHFQRDIILQKGRESVVFQYPVPCKIKEGQYYWSGVIIYTVHDIQRQTNWESEPFSVVK